MSGKETLLEIVSLAYEINQNTNHHVFVDISPHVDRIDIRVYENGWKHGKYSRDFNTYIIENDNYNNAFGHTTASEIISVLKELNNG